ncbi:CPBP family intramembrane glutamic endopeptidase [Natronolimnohabitans innermongolicus]|uniref:CAAX prenyl protease 2/Lysostaphin resistance protein A-like domain-containing protein n=1 Tax=Natronolimnohabitans innermongolicus JCM 12255 TaxID=1227499 RepID=L9XDU0_9EURY|nr:type II CAAX endopeptidase family protein [Natronolimnohabitans innermongolicus]ELY59601.1 hypothetical protein C493_05030 [Natronolimnohabitans innermongolicus JCM 12255]
MTQWTTFVGITGVVLVLLLVLSHLTQSAFADGDGAASESDFASGSSQRRDAGRSAESAPISEDRPGIDSDFETDYGTDSNTDSDTNSDLESRGAAAENTEVESRAEVGDAGPRTKADADLTRSQRRDEIDPAELSTGELLANVALSQGLFALVLIGAAIYTAIPADALGIEFSWAYLEQGLLWGTVAGLALYVANEVGAAAATRFGFDHDEQLRELLAPDSTRGWLVLLLFVLPIIAVFEELLFRAAMIGAVSAGFGVDPWLLAVVSSVAFAVGHGMQGSVGVVVTGVLGFVLAALFIVTGSFLVVVVAHYLINALEFAVHEGVGVDWAETLES